jgi:hypothetical protein
LSGILSVGRVSRRFSVARKKSARSSGTAFRLGSCGFEGVDKNSVDLSDGSAAVALELGPELIVCCEPSIGLQHLGSAGSSGKDAGNYGIFKRPDAGEMFVVPKGVEHKPCAEREVKLLLIEPRGVPNTGHEGGPRTAENNVWI